MKQKTNKFLSVIMAAAFLTGMASCSNEDDGTAGGSTTKGEPTTMQFVINAPKAPTTYAATDNNATDAEVELKTVNVLIYEYTATGFQLEKNASLTMADFEAVAGTDKYELKESSKIATTTGQKKMYVAMNYNGTLGSLPAVGSSITDIKTLKATLSNYDDLSKQQSGFAMFSTDVTDADLVPEDDAAYDISNKKTITVKRLVAKITVQEKSGLSSNGIIASQGGWLSSLQFTLGNINKSAYLLQNVVGSVVQDFNWSSFTVADFFAISDYSSASSSYKTVDAYATTVDALTAMYCPENTAQAYESNGSNLTYVSVRARYVPEFFCNQLGVSKGNNLASDTPVSFWTVITTHGKLYYFDDESNADTFKTANAGSVKSDEYEDGLCYWRGYLNPNGTTDPTISGSSAAKFDVLRNVYYKATINSVKAPGEASDKSQVTEATSLIMTIDIQPWAVQTNNWDL
ncbi:putative Lipoprotein [uncultured Dysgonomonas sp.]|uniref:Putative Lipoprotein n=1 Tax=uncultured Dysgonomonas sp. TaxID=206096 RepID=A0A212K4S5_9BACT|nr:Mfa1 family fimbria major subunit [uncultured Dysgonomonas sp.]SBW06711.1 putative Lipoprotein [uncultured Dysgonomonas sp.]